MKYPTRRTFLGSLGVVGIGSSAFVSPERFGTAGEISESIPAGTWPMDGRTPQRTGYQPQSAGPPAEHELAWERSIGGPAVATDEILILISMYEDNRPVKGISGADGSIRWEKPLPPNRLASTMAVRKETLYVATKVAQSENEDNFTSNKWKLFAIDVNSGSIEWARAKTGDIALVAGQMVICSDATSNGTVAIDAETGATRWKLTEYKNPELVANETIGFEVGHELIGVDPVTGAVEWTVDRITDDPERDIVIHDGVLYGNLSEFKAVDTKTDSVLWRTDRFDFQLKFGTMALATDGQRIYASVKSTERVVALDPGSGTILWTKTIEDLGYKVPTRPAVTDDALYVPVERGVAALDPATGDVLDRFEVNNKSPGRLIWTQLLVAGGQVYQIRDATVVALR